MLVVAFCLVTQVTKTPREFGEQDRYHLARFVEQCQYHLERSVKQIEIAFPTTLSIILHVFPFLRGGF